MKVYRILFVGLMFLLAPKATYATESFREIGKIIESPDNHSTQHDHDLRFLNLRTGETIDIVDSPELVQEHCKTGQSPVVEVQISHGSFFILGQQPRSKKLSSSR